MNVWWKKHWPKLVLGLIFALTLGIRLYFSFTSQTFTYESYFTLRQVEVIRETGLPAFDDHFSYGGRFLPFPPFFYYLLAFFHLIMPLKLVGQLIPQILISLLGPVAYLIAKKVTNRPGVSLFTAFISGFVPAVFKETVNSLSPYTLIIPLVFFALYCLMRLENKRYIYYYIVSVIILSFTHPVSFLLILGLVFYLIITRIEEKKLDRQEGELIAFSFFFFLWAQIILYKKALLMGGMNFIWGNIPSGIMSYYFSKITFIEALVAIGIIPFIAGIFIIYKYLFKQKNKEVYLSISFALGAIVLLWLGLMEPRVALMFLGVVFVLLFSETGRLFWEYFLNTKFVPFRYLLLAVVLLLFIFNSIYPSIGLMKEKEKPLPEETEAALWMKGNLPSGVTVLSTVEEGHLIAAVGEKRNFMDDNFILIDNIDKRFQDLERIFKTSYEIEALDLLNNYGASYIFFSSQAQKQYDITKLNYLGSNCFSKVYTNEKVKIYKVLCGVERK